MGARFSGLCAAVLVALLLPTTLGAGAPPSEFDYSLSLMPEDTALYVGIYRTGEQIEAVRGSRAWAKFVASPAVAYGRDWFQAQAARPTTAMGRLAAISANPIVRAEIEKAEKLCSKEMFVWVDGGFTTSLRQVRVPSAVIGFEVADPDHVQRQLDALALFLKVFCLVNEKWQGRIAEEQIGPGKYVILSLDSRLLFQNTAARRAVERLGLDPGAADAIGELVPNRKLVVAIGMRDKYLLISVGDSTAALRRIGRGKRLVDRPEFKPLGDFTTKRITGILYAGGSRPASGITFWDGSSWHGYLYRRADTAGKQADSQSPSSWQWKPKTCPPECDIAVELLPVFQRYIERRLVPQMEPQRQATYRRVMTVVDPCIAAVKQVHTMVKLFEVVRGVSGESQVKDGFQMRHVRVDLGDIE